MDRPLPAPAPAPAPPAARPRAAHPLRAATLALLALLALLAPAPAPSAAAPAAPAVTLVTCAPGYPGTTAEAQPAMDAFAAAATAAARWPTGRLAAVYFPGEAEGLARLGQPDAAVALVPLPFLAAHGAALRLVPRLAVERPALGPAERWALVAPRGLVHRPTDLAGFTVESVAGYAPSFVREALAGWGPIPAAVPVRPTARILSVLRRIAAGERVAALLDGEEAAALASLPFAAEVEVVALSAPMPAAVVATVGDRLPPGRWRDLSAALAGLAATPDGAAALSAIRVARLSPLDPSGAAIARRLAGEAR